MSLLEVKNLNVFYGNIHAIKDVSLEVDKGEIVSLIGANGAGKTTTLQTISGIIRSKSGEIIYNGKDITKTKAYLILKEGIAQVPEGRRIFAHLTVYDNLMLGGYSIKDSAQNKKREIEEIYKKLPRLEERKNQLAGTLSGGEQQMLAIGRGIMSRPQILILDEPSMGLSPLLVKEIFEIIKELNKNNGTTVLLVEQNAKMALGISDRAYVLETGKIIKTGLAKDLLNDDIVRKAYLGA
ncbi:ABC transporter, ATP-binding protein [Peptostreptococcaceae bacterium AS15]|nr:ABC transporter, ATP-binding protein [Peptostreptococcaceae bacterium AS15]